MREETIERIVKGAFTLTALGVAAALAPPTGILAGLAAGVAGEWLGGFSGELLVSIVKEKWLNHANPAITNHLQRVLYIAFDKTLADIQVGYIPQTDSEKAGIQEFLDLLKTKGEVAFLEAVREEFDQREIQQYVTATSETIGSLLDTRLDLLRFTKAVSGFVTPEFILFFRENLPERMRFHFREALKDKESPEAKAALDLLFQETVLAALERFSTDSETRRQDAEKLYQQARQTHQQVEFYGEIWLSAIRQVREQLNRIESNTERALEKLDALGTDVSGIKEKIASLSPSAVVPDFVASERFQQLTADVQRLQTEFETIRLKKERVERTAVTLDGEAAELLHEQTNSLTISLLRLDGERQAHEHALSRFVNDVLRLAEMLGVNPTSASERMQRARVLFEAGQFAEADAVLNENDLRDNKARLQAGSRNLAQEFLMKANLTVLSQTKNPDWFAQARAYYLDAVEIFEDYETTTAAGYFFQSCNQFSEAVSFYEKALQKALTDNQKSVIFNNLGILQQENNVIDEAKMYFQNALVIRRQLSQDKSQNHLSELASSLNNLGNLYRCDSVHRQDAEICFNEALSIRRELTALDPNMYKISVAGSLNNLGVLLADDNNRFEDAKQYYLEALDIYRQLVQDTSNIYLPLVAATINNLAVLLMTNYTQQKEAEFRFNEALNIYQKLAQNNPAVYLPHLAGVLNNLGNILTNDSKRYVDAEVHYFKALEIRRKLYQTNAGAYQNDLATTLNSIGNLLYKNATRRQEVEPYFKESISIRRQLAERHPTVYNYDLAMVLSNLGVSVADESERRGEAEELYTEALHIYKQLSKNNPSIYQSDIAKVLNNLGNLLSKETDRRAEAEQYCSEATAIYRQLIQENADIFEPHFATSLHNLGVIFANTPHQYDKAKSCYFEALKIRRKLAKIHPMLYDSLVAKTLHNLGALFARNNQTESINYFHESLEIRRQLVLINPAIYTFDLAQTLINISIYYIKIIPNRERSISDAREAFSYLMIISHKKSQTQDSIQVIREIYNHWEEPFTL